MYELRSCPGREQLEECVVTKGESPGTLLAQISFLFVQRKLSVRRLWRSYRTLHTRSVYNTIPVYSHLGSPSLGLCYLLDFRKADLRCGVTISWAFTFFSPWKPDSLLCLPCIHFPLPSHLPTTRWGFFFFLVLALRARERQSTSHQIKSLVLSGLGARLLGARLCVLVSSPDRWGPRPPRRRGLVPAPPGWAGH